MWVPVTMAWHVYWLQTLDMEGSWKYIEEAVTDNQQGIILQLGSWARG